MKHQFFQSTMATVFTVCLFYVSQTPVLAAPGSLGNIPLFVAPPTPPNIFFMLDDSGSMHWAMPSQGSLSGETIILKDLYDTMPDDNREWRHWCLGANLLAYDPTIEYKPWAGVRPGTGAPFPDQKDLTKVWPDPLAKGSVNNFRNAGNPENNGVQGRDNEVVDLSAAPVVAWTDQNGNGIYDVGSGTTECPGGNATTGYADPRVRRADSLSAAEQINFANWFSYYRIREHTTKAAVIQVVSSNSARMGMSTLHNNNNVGIEIKEMSVAANKDDLLEDVANINSSGGTPLRQSLYNAGKYFDQSSSTPSALNISTASADKPILSAANGGECQQNFTMLMTDGQWNGSFSSSGHQDQSIDNNFVYPAHKDDIENTLGDIAMKWYKTDLAPGLAPKVPKQDGANTQNLDQNKQQHMVTFGVAFGPTGTITADPIDRTQAFTWPKPTSNAIETVDDLRHAAYNGRGEFLSAKNPQTLTAALQSVITNIEARQGSAAAVSFSSTSLVAGTSLFFASFDTTDWSGDLRAFSIDPVTGILGVTPQWSAASVLDSRANADIVNRTIYTTGLDATAAKNGVLFNWSTVDPQPATVISDDFKTNPDITIDVAPFAASQTRLNFVRGDTSNDGVGLIRNRSTRLSDIINSPPHFVGSPISNWPNSGAPFNTYVPPYSAYQSGLETTPRQGMVYVGANDGLLHGFNANSGQETFAYLPSSPASSLDNEGLHYLTQADYQHRYYVDGTPIVTDVYMRIEPLGTQAWRTILVGSLRGGGQGIYALDVTDPSQFLNTQAAAKNAVLWEFTNQDDADLGFTFSEPQVTMMNNNEWAVIVGNGYNATGTDTAKLMILFIEKGIDGNWAVGDYIKLDTGVGTAVNKNGLSTPTLVDLDGDGKTDRIYAGDLHSNMWAFDVSDPLASNWEIAHEDLSANKVPLFTAAHHAGSPPVQVLGTPTPQPITMKPLVVKPDNTWVADDVTNVPNLMVYFGTGQYLATGDATNTDQQTFYGIWDAGTVPATGASVSPTRLVEQTFLPGFPIDARILSLNSVTYATPPSNGDLGWFINLPETGERVVVDAFQLAGLVFFNTLTPSIAPCSAGGNSWLMAVDQKTGGNPAIAAFDINGDRGLDSGDLVSDGSGNTAYASGVAFKHGIASATAVITNDAGASFGYISGTDSNDPHLFDLPSGGGGGAGGSTGVRKTWRQLFN